MATMKAIITNIAPKANGGPGTTSCKTENYFYLIICHRFWNISLYVDCKSYVILHRFLTENSGLRYTTELLTLVYTTNS